MNNHNSKDNSNKSHSKIHDSLRSVISEGDPILLFLDERRRWLVKAINRDFHTHKGIVNLNQSTGKIYGTYITSSLGYKFWLLKPTIFDFILSSERPTQIIYPKDIGLIILKLGISPGKKILEIGTGSGALTVALANIVKPDGHVYSYELREKFAAAAFRRLRKADLTDYVTIRIGDAAQILQEDEIDACTIDIGAPWEVISKASEALKPSASIASFSPTFNQVEKMVEIMKNSNFLDIQTYEIIMRKLKVEKGATRPHSTSITHTGYITFARKILGNT